MKQKFGAPEHFLWLSIHAVKMAFAKKAKKGQFSRNVIMHVLSNISANNEDKCFKFFLFSFVSPSLSCYFHCIAVQSDLIFACRLICYWYTQRLSIIEVELSMSAHAKNCEIIAIIFFYTMSRSRLKLANNCFITFFQRLFVKCQ